MTSEQDRLIKEALAVQMDGPDAAFTAAVLHRVGRRRRRLRWVIRLIIFAAAVAIGAALAAQIGGAYALIASNTDMLAFLAGVSLLFFCALAVPVLSRR